MTRVQHQQANLLDLEATRTLRVAVVGNVDSGKSTLNGVLSHSTLDDGNGSSRRLITKCKHELETGRTSTISTHLMGFDENAHALTIPRSHTRCPESFLGTNASRIVALTDLAGHEKYFRTTTTGLSQSMSDYALVLVSANQPPTHMTIHHLNLCVLFNVPVVVVVTKTDSTPKDVLQHTMKRVQQVIREATNGKMAFEVRNMKDTKLVQNKMESLVPVVKVSSVPGDNLDVLKQLLYSLPRRRRHENKIQRDPEFLVESIFTVQGVGTVLSGFVNAGAFYKGGTVYVGPTKTGGYIKAVIKTIHVMQTLVEYVYAGHAACFAVTMSKQERKSLVRRRMYVFDKPVEPTKTFVADIILTKGSPVTMTKGKFAIQMHILHQRPTCRLVDFESVDGHQVVASKDDDEDIVLRPGQTARVHFRLIHGTYYVRPGMRVVLRNGNVRGVGKIVETFSVS
eukprot:scaffold6717_cov160-Amphora_coffeaeformis.AAC.8